MPTDVPFHVDDVPAARREIGALAGERRRLADHAGARRLGIALISIDPGRQFSPPHVHADEDEAFLVLAGDGLALEWSPDDDVRTYPVRVDDLIWREAGGVAHTLIAGDAGMTVLVAAEGSRNDVTYLPRTRQFWLGPRWSPADTPPPFAADAELGPLELPEPTAERPPTIANLADLPVEEGREGILAHATRGVHQLGADRLVLAQDSMPPDTHTTDLHFHSAREEAWYVRSGGGIARLGEEAHELRPGSFWFAREDMGIGHRVEVGPEGMELVTIGDRIPGDIVVYPEKRTYRVARGVELPY
jgi:uncharacterized cupin superfamily protein